MPLDAACARTSRQHRGRRSYQAGLMAEDAVARHYQARGVSIRERRWRGEGGEIDLVASAPDGAVFVEVKQSSSFDRAAEAITPRQVWRIMRAASEYVSRLPAGQLTPMRFDLALVDGSGEVRVVENAFGW